MVEDRGFRVRLCTESLYWFSQYYFRQPSYAQTPDFHREIIRDLENLKEETYVLAAGRGMGKSSLTLYFILWRVLCRGEKFVIVLSKTDRQVGQLLENAQDELDGNERLLKDFGPIKRVADKWGRSGLEVGNYDAKIIGASMEQTIRGMRHRHHRPGLFVLDDIEDSASVKSAEAREKILNWYERDIVPAGDEYTKIVIVGGILHPNSFLAHMREAICKGKLPGLYREYPFLDADGKCLWPERYPTQEAIDRVRLKSGSLKAFLQEYLLQVIEEENQVIPYEWFNGQDYDELPDQDCLSRIIISVDPASSKKEHADYTAIVVMSDYHLGGEDRAIYVHPNPINERLSGLEIEEKVVTLYELYEQKSFARVIIETTSQNYLSERLSHRGVRVEECRPKGDKRERLMMAGAAIQAKIVFFPREGCDRLKQQLVGFGYEKHDDLCDAFSEYVEPILKEFFCHR